MKIETHLKALSGLPQGVLHPGPGVTQSHSTPCRDLDDLYHAQEPFASLRPSPFLYSKTGFLGSSRTMPLRYEHTHQGVTYMMWLHKDRTALLGRYIGNYAALEILPWNMRLSGEVTDPKTGAQIALTKATREPCIFVSARKSAGTMPVLRMGRQSDYPAQARAEAKLVRQILNKDIRRAFAAIEQAPPLGFKAEEIDACADGSFAYPQFLRALDVDEMGDINELATAMAIKILGQFRNFPTERVSIMGRSVSPDGQLGLPAVRTRYDDYAEVNFVTRLLTAQVTVLLDSTRSPLKLSEQIRRSEQTFLTIGQGQVDRDDLSAHDHIEAAGYLQQLLPDPSSSEVQQLLARLPDLTSARCDALPLAA